MQRTVLKRIVLVVALIATYNFSNAQCGQLVWSDEFNGNSIDDTKWDHDLGDGCPLCGWGNAELQNYTNSSDNIRVVNGILEIEARNDNGYYTSARLTTKGKHSWKYGRFEMRAKLAAGTGLWPAFWLLPNGGGWPQNGEIDIMENRGDWINHVGGTLHYGSSYPNNQHDGTGYDLPSGTFEDEFHVFAVEWEAGEIRWYMDEILYKTETANPNSLNPASTDNPWPWDNNEFYLILNMAIGGPNTWYTGLQNANFGSSATMQVDYVRVYSAAQPTKVISGPAKVFEQTNTSYSVENGSNENYTWSVPEGATITNGQGTNSINVNWGNASGGDIQLDVQHNSGACSGNTFFYSRAVEVFDNTCEFHLENFDEDAAMTPGYRSGEIAEVNNPGGNNINSSARSGKYDRNNTQQYDVLIYESAALDPAADYVSGQKVFKADIRTNAPIGTKIDIQVGNADFAGDFPNGVHSIYTASTSVQNQWETLTFSYVTSPDPNGGQYDENLDRMIFLFNPDSYTNHTYYIDNIRRELAAGTNELTLIGDQALDDQQSGVTYEATGGSNGSSYEWSLPKNAVITAGEGTSNITVDFSTSGGRVSVLERLTEGCTGEPASMQVAVGDNSCFVFADEFETGNSTTWVTVNGDAGFASSQTTDEWVITSTGHDEWANIDFAINDGAEAITVDFTLEDNLPLLHLRAKASKPVILRATFIDANGAVAGNTYLLPLNTLYLDTEFEEYTINFDGQFWDEWNGGGELDQSKIETIQFSINPGWATYPEDGYGESFEGTITIDYIQIGESCSVTGLTEKTKFNQLEVFPNPFTHEMTFTGIDMASNATVEISNVNGVVVQSGKLTSNTLQVDAALPEGIYFVRVISGANNYTSTISKQ